MSWQIIIIVILGGILILVPLLTYLSSRRMVGKKVSEDQYNRRDGLLYFYSVNCGPCRNMTPVIDRLSREDDRVNKINVSEDPDMAQKYGVNATPTTILVKGHVIKEVMLGARSQKQLERLLTEIN
ncbi:MAG: thioredoxin family protein [Gammaproteobacteria bacterium]|nr:thioredoxin family protein [Gammaproteobacteria bacterium]